jgi:hypothetical protein
LTAVPPVLLDAMIWGEPDECLINELKADMESTNSTGFSRNLSTELLLRYEAGYEVESSSNESIMIEQNHGQLRDSISQMNQRAKVKKIYQLMMTMNVLKKRLLLKRTCQLMMNMNIWKSVEIREMIRRTDEEIR